jgi:ABC-type oligopeptide transport system substrate-binding subunit
MISMSQKPQNNFWIAFLTVVLLAVILTLVSCNGSKKAKSSSKTETITVFVRDTVHVKVVDTSKITTELQEFITKTIEIFDTTYTEVPQIRQRIIYENIKMRKEMKENGISKDSTTGRTNFAQSATTATNSQTKETKKTPWYLILGIVIIVLFYMTGKKYNILR